MLHGLPQPVIHSHAARFAVAIIWSAPPASPRAACFVQGIHEALAYTAVASSICHVSCTFIGIGWQKKEDKADCPGMFGVTKWINYLYWDSVFNAFQNESSPTCLSVCQLKVIRFLFIPVASWRWADISHFVGPMLADDGGPTSFCHWQMCSLVPSVHLPFLLPDDEGFSHSIFCYPQPQP